MAYSYTYLIPARIRSGRIPDAKTGPDLYEHLGRNPFVMMSANWWEDGTWRTRTCLKAIFSWTKWMLILMCFVQR